MEIKDYINVKKKQSIKQWILIFIVICVSAVGILIDYVRASFSAALFNNAGYWITLLSTNAMVIAILLIYRSYKKDIELNENMEVKKAVKDATTTRVELSQKNLATVLNNYIEADNRSRKLRTYENSLRRKLMNCHSEKRREKLQGLLDSAPENINFIKVKYNKVRECTLFSGVKMPDTDDEDYEDGEGREIFDLLIKRAVCIVIIGIYIPTVVFTQKAFSIGALINTFNKLFQIAMALYIGGTAGIEYVRGKYLAKLNQRAIYIQRFVENSK